MNIGIDIDGTITDLHSQIIKYGLEYNDKILGNLTLSSSVIPAITNNL